MRTDHASASARSAARAAFLACWRAVSARIFAPKPRSDPRAVPRDELPFNSFAEYAPETKKKDVVWFALIGRSAPTEFKGDRGTKSKPIPGLHLVYNFLTTAPTRLLSLSTQKPCR
jgi:hypothetical protein